MIATPGSVELRNGRALGAADFVQVGAGGVGDAANSYAFAMAWFGDRLYVGTVRNALALVAAAPPRLPVGLDPWPVPVPSDLYTLDNRAQLLAYDPVVGRWERAMRSPVVAGVGGEPVPRELAYRSLTIFEGARDDRPALYVWGSSSNSRGLGVFTLRYDDRGDVAVSQRALLGDRTVSSVRSSLAAGGRLYLSPTGQGRAWNQAESPQVFTTVDPLSGRWQPISEPHFGDATNDVVYSLAVFRDRLYAGTLNPVTGYQVWRTETLGPPYKWHRVIDGGAGRGNLNECALSMCVFHDALYVGSGIANGGYDRTYGVGPAPAELVRIFPDDSWELVVGESRITSQGYLEPRSGLGPGFGNRFGVYVWRMAVHHGCLYAGTLDLLVFALWRDPNLWKEPMSRDRILAEVEEHGGAELWRSSDGIAWEPVTLNGFGNPFNYGCRTLLSTPAGLFVGTANPFGPEIAIQNGAGFRHETNPRGGAEIWLGR